MDNLLVRAAKGDFVIWCDSDDVLHPQALETLLAAWDALPPAIRADYMGVSARAETEDGVLGQPIDDPAGMSTWNDLYFAVKSDLVIMARANLLKSNPFVEIDYLIPETSVWNALGVKKSLFVDVPLAKKYYGQPFALSFTGKMQYSRGRAYALAKNYTFVRKRLGLVGEFVRSVKYIRYCFHGDMRPRDALRNWTGSALSHFMLVLAFLPATLLIIRDLLRGVVEKTHIPFEQARKRVEISYKVFPSTAK